MDGSWKTSTTSQMLLATVLSYLVACLLFIGIGAWRNELDLANVAFSKLDALLPILIGLYGVRKGAEAVKNGHADEPATTP